MSTQREIWDRYEANIDRVRANLTAKEAADYRELCEFLFRNPDNPTTRRMLDKVQRLENKANGTTLIVGNCFSWGNDGGEP